MKHVTKLAMVSRVSAAAYEKDWERVQQLVEGGDDVNGVGGWIQRTGLHNAALYGNTAICEFLLKRGGSTDVEDRDGNQALHLAAENCHFETVQLLLDYGADPNAVNSSGKTPLHKLHNPDYEELGLKVCEILLKHGAKVDAVDGGGNQPLHFGAKGLSETVALMISYGADTNAENNCGQTPLHIAAKGPSKVCEILLEHSGRIDAMDGDGNQPLHLATSAETANVLMSHGADTNSLNKHRQTPLHVAVNTSISHLALCESLLIHDAKINEVGQDGNQPLHLACKHGNYKIGSLLVVSGADVTARNRQGATPLQLTRQQVLKRHVLRCRTRNCDHGSALHLATATADVSAVKLLVECGADVDVLNKCGQTPLHSAAGGGKDCPKLCETLLKLGAKIGITDEDGNQPLHLACKQGYTKTGKLFLSFGADCNAVNKHGQTPLATATDNKQDCSELCVVLLKNGAKIDVVDKDGNEPLHTACHQGHTETSKLLLSNGANVNAINKHGETPLHVSCRGLRDCPEICESLLEQDAKTDVMDENGNQPLHLACNQGRPQIVKVLVTYGADVNAVNKLGQAPLHITCNGEKDFSQLCEILLNHNANIDAVDGVGNHPLHLACKRHHYLAGILLVSHGADITAVDGNGYTPLLLTSQVFVGPSGVDHFGNHALHIAAKQCRVQMTHLLLGCGADVNAKNYCGQTPLHEAANGEKDFPEMCEILLKHGAKVNEKDKYGSQPLHMACQQHHPQTGILLVAHNADVTTVTKRGDTPLQLLTRKLVVQTRGGVDSNGNHALHLALGNSNIRTTQLLLDCGADANAVNEHGQTALHMAALAQKNSSALCEVLLKHNARVDAVDRDENQPLHSACSSCTEAVKLLVSLGSDTNALNKHGRTPLHSAASGSHSHTQLNPTEVCEILVTHCAKIDIKDEDGNQPLHLACIRGCTDIAAYLISQNANVNAVNNQGLTPLHMVACRERESPQLCELLLKHGAKIDAVSKSGNQPFHLACRKCYIEIGVLLVTHGADVTAVNANGLTPLYIVSQHLKSSDKVGSDSNHVLHVATKRGEYKYLELLLSCGADVNSLNKYGQTALHVAATCNYCSTELCETLLRYGAKIDAVDEDGNQPLHLASKMGHMSVGELLVTNGADVNSLNKYGQTALHMAATCNYYSTELCETLLRYGAKIDAVDEDGNQPLHLASKMGHMSVGELLVTNGADVNGVDKNGQTALHMAANIDKASLCETLLNHDAKIDSEDGNGNQPLHLASKQGHMSITEVFVTNGANVNAVNKSRQTPLHTVAGGERDFPITCEILLNHSADANAVDEGGDSPSHIAAKAGNVSVLYKLFENGANWSNTNNKGVNALDHAKEYNPNIAHSMARKMLGEYYVLVSVVLKNIWYLHVLLLLTRVFPYNSK